MKKKAKFLTAQLSKSALKFCLSDIIQDRNLNSDKRLLLRSKRTINTIKKMFKKIKRAENVLNKFLI